jgi:hypothetical protein
MRRTSIFLLSALLLGDTAAQAGGLLHKIFSRNEGENSPLFARPVGVKLLELEIVQRPARPVAGEFATVQFRVKQLTDPDPQYIPPPVRIRQFTLSGVQLQHQWLHPNGEGIYEASVPMKEARRHYLYFETGTNRIVLAKVPWVVLRAAE